jgi:type II secretory pathway component PulF
MGNQNPYIEEEQTMAKRKKYKRTNNDLQNIYIHFPVLSSFMTYHRICNYINTMGVTSGAGIAYPSGAPEFTPGF